MPINQHRQTVMDGQANIDFQYDSIHKTLGIGISCPLGNVATVLSNIETESLVNWIKNQVME